MGSNSEPKQNNGMPIMSSSFNKFMYSSQVAARQLRNFFPQRGTFPCRYFEPRCALLDGMTSHVSFNSRCALLALGEFSSTLIKRLLGSNMRNGGLKHSLSILCRRNKFNQPKHVAVLTKYAHSNLSDTVCCVAFDQSNRFIATGNADHTINVWDLQSGQRNPFLLTTLRLHERMVRCLMFHPTKFILASGGNDNKIILWKDAKDGKGLVFSQTLSGHRDCITAIQFFQNGEFLLSGSFDGILKVWDLSSVGNKEPTCISSLQAHKSAVRSVLLHPHNLDCIITAGEDYFLKVWSLLSLMSEDLSPNCLSTEQKHLDIITSVAIDPITGIAVSGSWDNTVGLRKISPDGQLMSCQRSLIGDMVVSITFLPNGNFFITGCADNRAKIWKLARDGTYFHLIASIPFCNRIISVAVNPNGSCLAICLNNGLTFLYS